MSKKNDCNMGKVIGIVVATAVISICLPMAREMDCGVCMQSMGFNRGFLAGYSR